MYTEAMITAMMKTVSDGKKVEEVCSAVGISEATYYNWKKKFLMNAVPIAIDLPCLLITKERYNQLVNTEKEVKKLKSLVTRYLNI